MSGMRLPRYKGGYDLPLGKPRYPHEGDIWYQSIASIKRYWDSCDDPGNGWRTILHTARTASYMPRLKEILEKHGFVRPVTCSWNDMGMVYGDGHHRLAASIEIGYTHIPVEFFEDDVYVSDDWDWESNPILKNTPRVNADRR